MALFRTLRKLSMGCLCGGALTAKKLNDYAHR